MSRAGVTRWLCRSGQSSQAVVESIESRLLLSVSLVKDINTTGVGSGPADFVDLNGVALFTATDVDHGRELWRSDGTAAGTTLVKDITPGPQNASGSNYGPTDLVNANGTVYFSVPGSGATAGLWKTDGTTAGTTMVIPATSLLSSPSEITSAGNKIFFVAGDYQGGDAPALWVSNGTAAGAHPVTVANINAPASSPRGLVALGDEVFFIAANGNGIGLWRSDGTLSGTKLVAPLSPDSSNQSLAVADGKVYFVSDDGGQGALLATDGSNTAQLTPAGVNSAGNVVAFNGSVYFTAKDASGFAIWKTDGTPAGTAPVIRRLATHFAVSGKYLYFGSENASDEFDLFRTDGTAAGTVQLTSFQQNLGNPVVPETDLNGTLLFEVFVDRGHVGGTQLWKSDGTPAGTALLKDIDNPNLVIANIHGTAYMGPNDLTGGPELWKSDGTTAGTVLVKRINPATQSSNPRLPVVANGQLFFTAYDGVGQGLWKSDGTATGTTLVKDFNPDTSSFGQIDLTSVGGTVYFVEEQALPNDATQSTFALYRSDGTPAGTVPVMPLDVARIQTESGNGPYLDPQLTAVGDTLYFISDNSLWKTSPASSGATVVGGSTSAFSTDLVSLGNALYVDDNGFSEVQPKGSSVGPQAFRSGSSTAGSRATVAADAFNGSVYYLASTSVRPALYRIDGTTGAASLVKSFPGDALPYDNSDPTATSAGFYTSGGKMYFTLSSGVWVSDGTAAGTQLILSHGRLRVRPVALGADVYFIAADASTIRETQQLWRTDGTSAGTVLIKDNLADIYGRHQEPQLVSYNGLLYFIAPYEQMLWQSDGTPQGTMPVPGVPYMAIPVTDSTSILGVAGGKLLFSPSDPAHGNEPWALDTTPPSSGLVIHGTNANDVIAVSLAANGNLLVTVNGVTSTYSSAQYAGGITIDTGHASGSGDTLNLLGLPAVPTNVKGEGPLSVNVGSDSRGVQDISAAPLTIGTGSGQGPIHLTINDASDATARIATVDTTTIDGIPYGALNCLAQGTIDFDAGQVAPPVIVNAGNGGNHFIINHTPAGTIINLDTGNGADTVDVKATGAGSVLNINGQNGADSVNIPNTQGNEGSVRDIRGVVNVANPLGKTTLTVNDFGDQSVRTVTLDTFTAGGVAYGTLQGLAPAPINFAGAQMKLVNVIGGAGGADLITVNNTPGGGEIDLVDFAAVTLLGVAAGQKMSIFLNATAPPESVTIDFSTGRIAAGSNIFLEADQINIIGASATDSFTLNGAIVHNGATILYDDQPLDVLRLTRGTFNVTGDLMGITAYQVTADGADTLVQVKAMQHMPIVPVHGASVVLFPGANWLTQGGVPAIDGKLDLGTNEWDIINVFTDPAAELRALLRQGLGGKSGITSSAADARHNLGFIDSFDGSVFATDAHSVEIKYTLYGDLNLDGKVDFTDLVLAAQNFGRTNANWDQGDMNYDGKVDFSDLLKVVQNYGKSTSNAAPALLAASASALARYTRRREKSG